MIFCLLQHAAKSCTNDVFFLDTYMAFMSTTTNWAAVIRYADLQEVKYIHCFTELPTAAEHKAGKDRNVLLPKRLTLMSLASDLAPSLPKMCSVWPHLGHWYKLMFCTIPSTGTLTLRNISVPLRASSSAMSWGVVTITAPAALNNSNNTVLRHGPFNNSLLGWTLEHHCSLTITLLQVDSQSAM